MASLHAPEFFAELSLPFTDSTVVGNTYYATPTPGTPLRLRIEFTRTIYADTYGGDLTAKTMTGDITVTATDSALDDDLDVRATSMTGDVRTPRRQHHAGGPRRRRG